MQKWMGDNNFQSLRTNLINEELVNGKGEPDLFCWQPETKKWFFAEAKRKDNLLEHQLDWFRICHNVLRDLADIRVYQLVHDAY